jgi:hypothetical protein
MEIPHEIQQCQNATLRNNAIAAIHRGTWREQNMTLLECINYNKEANAEGRLEARKKEFAKWKQWFYSSS